MRILIFLFLMIPGTGFGTADSEPVHRYQSDVAGERGYRRSRPALWIFHFNPAGLTKLEGRQIQIQLMNIMLSAEANFSLPEDYDPDQAGLVPIHEDPILNDPKSKAIAAAYLPGVGILPMHLAGADIANRGGVHPAGGF